MICSDPSSKKMTPIRGINASSPLVSSPLVSILNKTDILTKNLTMSYHNITLEKANIASNNSLNNYPSISYPSDTISLIDISSILIPIILISFIIIGIVAGAINWKIINKNINILNLINKMKNIYKEYTTKQLLPTYHKKAKESPFIGSQTTLQLPSHHRLNGVEKGQNMQFKVSIPYRRLYSSENLASNEEHRITITTSVQKLPTILNSLNQK